MRNFPDKWPGDAQLWWTDARRGATIWLELASPHSGPCDASLFGDRHRLSDRADED